jgi:hypothetical protein
VGGTNPPHPQCSAASCGVLNQKKFNKKLLKYITYSQYPENTIGLELYYGNENNNAETIKKRINKITSNLYLIIKGRNKEFIFYKK